jgi:hypothetical protein
MTKPSAQREFIAVGKNEAGEELDEDGLTKTEVEYLNTPLKLLNQDQRMTAIAIKDKQLRARYDNNAAYRKAQDEAKAKAAKKAA